MFHLSALEGVAAPPLFNPGGKLPEPPLPNVVALYASHRGAGKSTAAKYLKASLIARGHKAHIVSFADALRELCGCVLAAFGYTKVEVKHLLQDAKDIPQLSTRGVLQRAEFVRENYGSASKDSFTGRDLLISVGDGARELLSPDVWCDALGKHIRSLNMPKDGFIIIDDMRRANEYEYLNKELDAFFVELIRGSRKAPGNAEMEGLLNDRFFDHMVHVPQDNGLSELFSEMRALAEVLSLSA